MYVNMMLVFMISGLWHGSERAFLLWGILHGLICVLERIFEKPLKKIHPGFRWFLTFNLVSVLWLLFRTGYISQWLQILNNILWHWNTTVSRDLMNVFRLPEINYILECIPGIETLIHTVGWSSFGALPMLILLAVTAWVLWIGDNSGRAVWKNSVGSAAFTALLIVLSLISLSGESVFVYFGF